MVGDMEKKELNHVIQSGRDKIQEFENEGAKALKDFRLQTASTLKAVEDLSIQTLQRIENNAKKAEQSRTEADTMRGEQIKKYHHAMAQKIYNFARWFILLMFGSSLLIAGRNSIVLQDKMSDSEVDRYFMSKKSSEKVYKALNYRLHLMEKVHPVPYDTTNYNWLIEGLFDERSRSLK